MADNPLNSSPVRVLAEEVTQRDGSALPDAAQGQIVLIAAQTGDGQVVTFDPRTLATAARQDMAKTVFDLMLAALSDIGGSQDDTTAALAQILDAVDGLETLNTAIRDRLPSALIHGRLGVQNLGATVGSGPETISIVGDNGAILLRSQNTSRVVLNFENISTTQTLYVGTSSGLTTSNGMRLPAGQLWEERDWQGDVYVRAPAGQTIDVRWWEIG